MKKVIFLTIFFLFTILFSEAKEIFVVKLNGVINQAVSDYIEKWIKKAEKENVECIIILLDTPGGLLESTESIYKAILNSKVPIVIYIYPKGAKADSAGIFITLSGDIIAMAPGTSMGAAHPITIGEEKTDKKVNEKIVSAVSAMIRGIAQKRGRDPKWAEDAVRKSKAVTTEEAVKLKLCDIVAEDINDLLNQLNGRKVVVQKKEKILNTKDATLKYIEMSQREKFLQTIGNPNIAYILFVLGMLGLIYEFFTPGFGFPGIVGGICLILALYGFHTIGPSLAGLLLIIVAILLFIADIKAATHGGLAIGGVIAFILGSLMLFSPQLPYFKISLSAVGTMTATIVVFFLFIIAKGLAAQKAKVISGKEAVIGTIGTAQTNISEEEGIVYAAGEEWSAYTEGEKIKKGEKVRIVGIDGVRIKVEKIKEG
jgi:membrane-bound serine protease (ClpP class)